MRRVGGPSSESQDFESPVADYCRGGIGPSAAAIFAATRVRFACMQGLEGSFGWRLSSPRCRSCT
jgi:hypothetical protein